MALTPRADDDPVWPALPYAAWKPTLDTLHMWTQVVGKVKLELTPFLNEWWNITFAVTARGLTTSLIPFGQRMFQVDFDFVDHSLWIHVTDGSSRSMPLVAQPVADFYREFMANLESLGIQVKINTQPVEVDNGIRFEEDRVHASYDPLSVNRCWRILVGVTRLLERFRTPFVGKSSPVQFWWGSFDLSTTRFSGRAAPPRQWPTRWMALGGQHEETLAGFWPGNDRLPEPAFVAYTYPEPPGLPHGSHPTRRRLLPPRAGRVHSALPASPISSRSRPADSGFLPQHLRNWRNAGRLGSRRARKLQLRRTQAPSCTSTISSASRPCAARWTAVIASRSGASDRQKTLPVRFVVPVADEAHAEARLNGQVLLVRRRDRLARESLHFVVDVHEKRHGAQHTLRRRAWLAPAGLFVEADAQRRLARRSRGPASCWPDGSRRAHVAVQPLELVRACTCRVPPRGGHAPGRRRVWRPRRSGTWRRRSSSATPRRGRRRSTNLR